MLTYLIWQNWMLRLKEKRCCWSGPFCLELEDCSELQQVDCTNRFVEENLRFDDVETEKSPKECRKRSSNQSHSLPKVKKKPQRSFNSVYMQKGMKKLTVYADISDSARLDAKRLNRWKGER